MFIVMYTNMQSVNEPAHSAEWTAYQYMRREILAGRLPGGAPLNQEKIAAELGLSRIPVRDAIRHLAATGLATIESNRRAIVTVLREGDLSELFEMRAVLEGLAVRHAVANLTSDDLDRLIWLADRLNKTESNSGQWMPVHDEFHDLLCSRSAMPMVTNEIRRLRQRVEPYVRVLITLHGAAELRMSRHNTLISAIRSRDPERAERVVREHIMQAEKEIVASIRSSPLGDTAVDAKSAGPEKKEKRLAQNTNRSVTG
jgi:DNA-binding GntR family transcriptional regulator